MKKDLLIREIAKKFGVSKNEVEAEMQKAICEGMKISSRNADCERLWKQISPDGNVPTVEEFLAFAVKYSKQALIS